MRFWKAAVLAVALVTVSACGSRTLVVPVAGNAHYPDFLEPAVPSTLLTSPATAAQLRAWQFLQAGDLRGADREANAALKIAPGFFPAQTTIAYGFLARRDLRGAVARFDRVLAGQPAYAPALVGKGQALAALNRDDEAVTAFEAALRADATLTDVARRLDVVRLRLAQRSITAARQSAKAGKYDEAMQSYRAAIDRSPDSAFLYRELAVIERDHDSGDAAIEHYRRAIALDPMDTESLADLAGMLDARNDFDAALKAYAEALAVSPDPAIVSKRDALRLRADIARLPPEYRSIDSAPQITRADLAALIGFRLRGLVAASPMRDVGVVTDVRGHWAERWISDVSRAGIMAPFDNHTFQPRAVIRRVDFAQAMMRLLTRVSATAPAEARRWQNARGRFPDLAASHVAYTAVSAVVAAGVMQVAADGTFQPTRAVTGAEATEAIVRMLVLSGSEASRP